MTTKGIDISKHNGDIDFRKVKNDGIDFAMIRAGYGCNMVDTYFHKNIKSAKENGIKCGVYWFSYAYTPQMAKKEAEKCIDTIKQYDLDYPVAFDFEYDSVYYAERNGINITKDLSSQIADTFLSTVKNAGYHVNLYTNIDFYINYFDEAVKEKYDIWLAAYRDTEPKYGQKMWQYSETGRVNGINGCVDMNISHYEENANKLTKDAKTVDITLPVLQINSKGNSVKSIQQLLNARGFSCGAADGIFGSKTKSAVTRYQKSKKLTVDGIVGKQTYQSILS